MQSANFQHLAMHMTPAPCGANKDSKKYDSALGKALSGGYLAIGTVDSSHLSTFSVYKSQLDDALADNLSRASIMSLQLLTNSSALTQACQQCKQHAADAAGISTVASCWLTATSILSKQNSDLHWWQRDTLWLNISQWSVPVLQHQLLDLTTALVSEGSGHPADSEGHTVALQAAAAILQFVVRCTKLLSRLKQRALTYDVRYKFKSCVITRWWESRGAAERVEAWLKAMDCRIQADVHKVMLAVCSGKHCSSAVQALLNLAVSLEQIGQLTKIGGKFITNSTWRKLVKRQSSKLSLAAAYLPGNPAAEGAAVTAGADVSSALFKLCELEELWRVDRQISLSAKPAQYCTEYAELRQQQKAGAYKLFSTDEFLRPKFPSKAAGFTEISGAWARPDAGNRRKIIF